MNLFKQSIGLMTATAAFSITNTFAQTAPTEPNVLMFIVDDWGAYDLSLTGSKLYETHNIDQLAKESTIFSQAYVAYPRSVPSRYSMITGRHCARPQTSAKGDDRKVDADSYCIAMPFKKAGYETFIIGKWHLSDGKTMPEHKGFDINIGAGKAGATSAYFAPFNKPGVNQSDKSIIGMEDAHQGEYLTDYMIRKTADYLQQPHKNPFFALCSFYAVHTPLQAKQEMTERYKKKIQNMGLGVDPMMKEEAGDRKTQQDHPVYAAMIESVDEGVGKLVQILKEQGLYDNTIIVLISDHGGLSNRGNKRELATTNNPLKAGKGHLYEGGIRVPLLIHAAGQNKRYDIETPVTSYDLLPTLADICNLSIDPNAELDGISIKNLINKKELSNQPERDLFWHKATERPGSTGDYISSAIRSGNYKLIDFYTQDRIELYDLQNDPGETKNLYKEKPEVASLLLFKLNNWRRETCVKMSNDNHKLKQNQKSNLSD
ncbi:MAG: sulfatase [Bacteroidales bacterium]